MKTNAITEPTTSCQLLDPNQAKPAITKQQIAQAKDYIAAGGKIEAIETKYKLTNEQRTSITKTL